MITLEIKNMSKLEDMANIVQTLETLAVIVQRHQDAIKTLIDRIGQLESAERVRQAGIKFF
jgi:hypothetical protein